MMANSRFLSVLAESVSTFTIFLEPASDMIAVLDAWETGHRMYAFRAIAYTVTAWAFNQAIPGGSQVILASITTRGLTQPRSEIAVYNKIWKETSQKVLVKIESSIAATDIPKSAVKIILRALAKDEPRTLCKMILKSFEQDLQPIPRLSWVSGYKILYPF